MTSHLWLVKWANSKVKDQMNAIPANCRDLLFDGLRRVAQSCNPCMPEGADVVEIVTTKGTFRLKKGDYRLFFQINGQQVIVDTHVYKGTIVVVGVHNRRDAYRSRS